MIRAEIFCAAVRTVLQFKMKCRLRVVLSWQAGTAYILNQTAATTHLGDLFIAHAGNKAMKVLLGSRSL